MSAEVRTLRARKAALERHYPNGDHSDTSRDLAAAKIEAYVQKVVAEAPPLTSEQRARLAALLNGGAA